MCDVDERAVVNAVDVPSIYDIPTMLQRAGSRRLHHRAARPRARARGRLGGLAAAAQDRARAEARGHDRPGRQVHRPARRLPLGHRGAEGRRVRAGDEGRDPLGARPTSARRPRAPRSTSPTSTASACPADSGCAASRASSARCISRARTGIPVLGLCLGLQCMVIEYARNVVGLTGAQLERVRPRHRVPGHRDHGRAGRHHRRRRHGRHDAPRPVRGGARRPARSSKSSTARRPSSERHRHRYEVNNHYREQIADAGMVFSGVSPDRELVEYVELPRDVHPFYVGTQAHPELRSRPNRPHPLFRGLVAAARERQEASRLFEVAEPGERAVVEVETDDATAARRAARTRRARRSLSSQLRGRSRRAAHRSARRSARSRPIVEAATVFEGKVFDVNRETVRLPRRHDGARVHGAPRRRRGARDRRATTGCC